MGKALEALKRGLAPFVSREFIDRHQRNTVAVMKAQLGRSIQNPKRPFDELDVAALLKVIRDSWNEVYRKTLGPAERSLVQELRGVRNSWAHQRPFSDDDTYRALDSTHWLLVAVSSPSAATVGKAKDEFLRQRLKRRRLARRHGGLYHQDRQRGGRTAAGRVSPSAWRRSCGKYLRGRVVTYGQVAEEAGSPGAAMAVGNIMRDLPEGTDVPWWRVIRAGGAISEHAPDDCIRGSKARG